MRKFLIFLTLVMLSSNSAYIAAQGMGNSSGSMPSGSSTMQKTPLLEKATPREHAKTPTSVAPPTATFPSTVTAEASYFYPGSVVFRNGSWVGGDNLLNLPRNIGLYISFIKPSSDTLAVNEDEFLATAKKIFEKANIIPTILVSSGQPPLPFFQVQVLLYPVEKGYAASCEGRLFESVNLQRVILEPTGMAYQAITWQKSSLIVSPREKVIDQLKVDIEDIVQSFADRYVTFDNIKNSLKK